MGVKERRQRERTEIRERILDAALEVFATEGVEGVTMRALADAIEYTPPVIYAHFRDKDAIIEELCYRQLRTLAQAFANFRSLDPVERLRQIGYVYVDFAGEASQSLPISVPHGTLVQDGRRRAREGRSAGERVRLSETHRQRRSRGRRISDPSSPTPRKSRSCAGEARMGLVALQNIKGTNAGLTGATRGRPRIGSSTPPLNGLVKPEAIKSTTRVPAPRARARRKPR
jgi:AcrR family transcriptional regulator